MVSYEIVVKDWTRDLHMDKSDPSVARAFSSVRRVYIQVEIFCVILAGVIQARFDSYDEADHYIDLLMES